MWDSARINIFEYCCGIVVKNKAKNKRDYHVIHIKCKCFFIYDQLNSFQMTIKIFLYDRLSSFERSDKCKSFFFVQILFIPKSASPYSQFFVIKVFREYRILLGQLSYIISVPLPKQRVLWYKLFAFERHLYHTLSSFNQTILQKKILIFSCLTTCLHMSIRE